MTATDLALEISALCDGARVRVTYLSKIGVWSAVCGPHAKGDETIEGALTRLRDAVRSASRAA